MLWGHTERYQTASPPTDIDNLIGRGSRFQVGRCMLVNRCGTTSGWVYAPHIYVGFRNLHNTHFTSSSTRHLHYERVTELHLSRPYPE